MFFSGIINTITIFKALYIFLSTLSTLTQWSTRACLLVSHLCCGPGRNGLYLRFVFIDTWPKLGMAGVMKNTFLMLISIFFITLSKGEQSQSLRARKTFNYTYICDCYVQIQMTEFSTCFDTWNARWLNCGCALLLGVFFLLFFSWQKTYFKKARVHS